MSRIAQQDRPAVGRDPARACRALEHPPLEHPVGVLEDVAGAGEAVVTCEVEISAHVLDGAFRRPLGGARRPAGRDLQAVPSSVGAAAGNRYLPETESSPGDEMLGVHFLGQVLALRDAVVDDQAGELRGARLREQPVADGGKDAVRANHQVEPPARPVAEDQLHARIRFVDIDNGMVQVHDARTARPDLRRRSLPRPATAPGRSLSSLVSLVVLAVRARTLRPVGTARWSSLVFRLAEMYR